MAGDRLVPELDTRAKLAATMAGISDAVFIADLEGNFVEFNEAFVTYHRFASRQDCFKNLKEYQECLEVFLPGGATAPKDQWAVPRALRGETATGAEFTLRRRDTGDTWVGCYHFCPIRDPHGLILGAFVTGRDITDLKQRESAIRKISTAMKESIIQKRQAQIRLNRFNRARETILQCTQASLHAGSEAELLQDFCRICTHVQGIEMAWVGLMVHDAASSISVAASTGFPDGAWAHRRLSWADNAFGQDPPGVAIRSGTACARDHESLRTVHAQRVEAPWAGTGATLALPLLAGDQTHGALVVHAQHPGHFDEQYTEMFMEVADNLSIGITSLRSRVERDQALGNSERLAEQLRSLALELGQTEQRERLRLAHVLHDHLQQLLVGATFGIETLSGHLQGETALRILDKVTETVQKAIHLSRVLTVELSPPAILDKGLAASLAWLAHNVQDNHGLKVALALEGDPEPVPEPVRLFIFEAVREILLNVVKHAKVDTACVRMRALEGERIEVTIEDRGVGFDPATLEADRFTGEGLGLFSLRERLRFLKGSMTIHSQAGHGSRFTLVVPIQGWPAQRK